MPSTDSLTNKPYQMTTSEIQAFQTTFMAWYDVHRRELPWRLNQEPYRVWLSEIMLQQTQVQTVIPYYERFLATFPTVVDLAAAPEELLLKTWEGLGYYSRARNLQKAARQIVDDYQGQWPQTSVELEKLAGIGPYTAGAIASICFGEVVPAIDGNAFRVFSRLLKIDADIANPKNRQIFYDAILPLIPQDRPGDFNQAVMDFGSQVCTAKNPTVGETDLAPFFRSYQDGTLLDYPVKTKKQRPKPVALMAVIIQSPQGVLLQKRPSTGLLANLTTYPLVVPADILPEDEVLTPEEILTYIERYFQETYAITLQQLRPTNLKPVVHTFTHLKWTIELLQAELVADVDLAFFPGQWYSEDALQTVALPTVQKKLMARIKTN